MKAGALYHNPTLPKICGLAWLFLEAGLILLFYTPYWQSWDDPALAMLINGYGLATSPSTNIPYCNFVWAFLIQHLPDLLGIANYTWAIYSASFLATALLWLALAANGDRLLLKLLTVTTILFYSFLNPQFTVTGLLGGLAAVCCFITFQSCGKMRWLFAAMGSALIAFIIRDWTIAFMAVLALPLIDWRALWLQKKVIIICVSFGFALCSIYLINLQLLESAQPDSVLRWNSLRQKLSDAHMGKMLSLQPELLHQYGYSENDINLLATHFSAAAAIMCEDNLNSMLKKSDPAINRAVNLEKVAITFDWFLSWPLSLLLAAALLLLLSRFSMRSLLIFILFAFIFLAIGYFNRGGIWINRIYYPAAFGVICLLLLVPTNTRFTDHIKLSRSFETGAAGLLLVMSLLAFSKANLIESWELEQYDLAEAARLLDGSVWYGHPVRIEQIYRPFAAISELKKIRFQCVSWPARLTNSRKYFDPETEGSFEKFLKAGFTLAIGKAHLEFIAKYCGEHLNGDLKVARPGANPDFYHVQCLPSEQAH